MYYVHPQQLPLFLRQGPYIPSKECKATQSCLTVSEIFVLHIDTKLRMVNEGLLQWSFPDVVFVVVDISGSHELVGLADPCDPLCDLLFVAIVRRYAWGPLAQVPRVDMSGGEDGARLYLTPLDGFH